MSKPTIEVRTHKDNPTTFSAVEPGGFFFWPAQASTRNLLIRLHDEHSAARVQNGYRVTMDDDDVVLIPKATALRVEI